MTTYRFYVPGKPVPQGSKVPGMRKDGSLYVREMLPGLRGWREAIQNEVHYKDVGPLAGPLFVDLDFVIPRPKSNRDAEPIKRSSGDIDKLARACLDAMEKAGAYTDDAQVCELHASKHYETPDGRPPGVVVTLRSLS